MRPFLAVLVLIAGAMPADAQWLDRSWPGIPRTADGKPNLSAPAPRGPDGKPDLTGVWDGEAVVARPDPADLQSWVSDLARKYQQEYFKTRPYYQCRPNGPEAERFGGWKRILQTPATLAILNDNLTYRVIHMDGRALEADPAPSWMGYSVGRWDGDTLVVDVTNLDEGTWLSDNGLFHSDKTHVVERFRREGDTLHYDVTVEDPVVLVEPWKQRSRDLKLMKDYQIEEAPYCSERDKDHLQDLSHHGNLR